MQINNDANANNVPKVNYDDKKYDVFFSCVFPNIDLNYLDKEGKIKLESTMWGEADFKSFSMHIADNRSEKDLDGKLYTSSYSFGCSRDFGYEFDINDRNFNVIFGAYEDLGSDIDIKKNVDEKQKEIKADERYIKIKSPDLIDEYVWNEKNNKENGTDLRDVIVPKMISRLETVKELAQKGIKNKSSLTTDVYARHRDKNSSLDSSFTKENYGEFGFASLLNEYRLKKMRLAINDKDVYFTEHNEVGVAPISTNQEWVLPKRLVFNVRFLNESSKRNIQQYMIDNINERIIEFCEANTKFYKSDIRIVDKSNKKTRVVSARQFKDILSDNKEFYSLLTEETKQKLDEMIKICEQKNIVQDNIVGKQTNNLYNNEQKEVKNKTDKVDCKCCNIF